MSIDSARLNEEWLQQSTRGGYPRLLTSPDSRHVPSYQQRVEALRSAHASTQPIQRILDACADPIVCIDGEGWFTLLNTAACRLLHCQADDLLGQDARETLNYSHPDGTPYSAAECPITAALHRGRQSRIEHVVFWRTDGCPIAVTCATRPVVEGGKVVGAVISFRDISARLVAEAHAAKILAEAQQLAKTRNESLHHMSHEIRTSLNAVLGLANFGAQESAEAITRETFAHIVEAGQVLLDILNNVLDLAKIEVGKVCVNQRPFSPGELVDRAADLISTQIRAKGLSLHIEKDASLPAICNGDDLRLLQILVNLLNNAVKFTSQGTVTLWAGWQEASKLVLRVTDTGIGIAEAPLARLFAPFEQADDAVYRHFGGSGLGLAIVKKLVDLMEGEILVQSHLGQGSTFEIRIPHTSQTHTDISLDGER